MDKDKARLLDLVNDSDKLIRDLNYNIQDINDLIVSYGFDEYRVFKDKSGCLKAFVLFDDEYVEVDYFKNRLMF